MTTHIIIPARYNSARLPGKALLDIAGKPMLQHVYERALATGIKHISIATDDQRIYDSAIHFNATVVMTNAKHTTGTDRIHEATEKLGLNDEDIIINVQGDEPLFPLSSVKQLTDILTQDTTLGMATLCSVLRDKNELFNRNVVKVVRDKQSNALFFSRATIPWSRDAFNADADGSQVDLQHYRAHIGIYAYRVKFLQQYVKWAVSPLEEIERLEQLRVLWHGEKIHVADARERSVFDVNTPDDLQKIRQWWQANLA